jgi:hypothetical protein
MTSARWQVIGTPLRAGGPLTVAQEMRLVFSARDAPSELLLPEDEP